MLYLMCCTVLMVIALPQGIMLFERLAKVEPGSPHRLTVFLTTPLFYFLPPVLFSAPIIATVLDGMAISEHRPIGLSSGATPVILSVTGALLALSVVSFRAVNAYRQTGSLDFWSSGALVMTWTMAGLGLFADVDQLAFTARHGAVVNFSYLRKLAPDIRCKSNVLIVQWHPSAQVARYRCPTGMILDPHSETPFIPWPGYKQGTSGPLQQALLNLQSRGNSGTEAPRRKTPTDLERNPDTTR